ncbi:MAG: hypothetical protein LBU77_06605, partial [Clostridiales bacterium]|nr:hypothetical protein [Clostridiales bacterium]
KSIQLLTDAGENPQNSAEWPDASALADAPRLSYQIFAPAAGDYFLNFFSASPDENSDSFYTGVNGEIAFLFKT